MQCTQFVFASPNLIQLHLGEMIAIMENDFYFIAFYFLLFLFWVMQVGDNEALG